MMAWILVRRWWWALPVLGLAAALLLTRATLVKVKLQRDAAVLKLDVTAASLDRLSAEMNAVLAAERTLAAGDARRIDASRAAIDIAALAARARQGAIDRLNRSATEAAPGCQASAAVREVWK